MFFKICNTTWQTVEKHDTGHMTYYSVNIAIRGFKEAIHRNVDKDPYTPSGTIPGMPISILMYSMLNSRQPGAHIQPWSLTQPYMAWGSPQEKSKTFQQLRPWTTWHILL